MYKSTQGLGLTVNVKERTRKGTNGQCERTHIGEDKHTMEKNAQGWGLTDNVKERTIKGTNGLCRRTHKNGD